MSILVDEDYANPTTPLWASAGSGGGGGNVKLIVASVSETTSGPLGTLDTIITAYIPMDAPAVSGRFLTNATCNVVGAAPNRYTMTLNDATNSTSLYLTADDSGFPIANLGGATLLTTTWNVGDPLPTIVLSGNVQSGSGSFNWTWDIVFYPN